MTDARGVAERWGVLTYLAGDALHVSARGVDVLTDDLSILDVRL